MRNEEKSVFALLKEGLESTLERVKTKRPLRVTQVDIPDPPPVYSSQDVVRLRARLNMSQSAFAALLAVSRRAVEKWEQGERHPASGSARLMQFIEHPGLLDQFAPREAEPAPRIRSAGTRHAR
ncbi:MAG: helix-turn-helix domain-containing protein [Proteobacteria bacterium]|nr:helix-turn-helix domain-containing protein [Pseudomonadota bacterium]